jgi:starch phosphorylase
VLFLPNYGVTLAERIIPGDVRNDLYRQLRGQRHRQHGEFAVNGALTVGTRGRRHRIGEGWRVAGDETSFSSGLTAGQVAASRGWYSPWWHYEREPETRRALACCSPGTSTPTRPRARTHRSAMPCSPTATGAHMHLHRPSAPHRPRRRASLHATPTSTPDPRAIINVASRRVLSDRTIREYMEQI